MQNYTARQVRAFFMGTPGMARQRASATSLAVVATPGDLEVKVLYTPGKGSVSWRQGDVLMAYVARQIEDRRVLTLILRYLEAGTQNVRSGPSLSGARTGCSATRPKAQWPALNFTVWSRRLKPTAKSPMRGCATHLNGCHKPRA